MPKFKTGLNNYYEAHLDEDESNELSVVTIALDSFPIEQRIALIKIDVEGHELSAIKGMESTIKKHLPNLIVETGSETLINLLTSWGYTSTKYPGSPNMLFKPS